MTAQQAFEDHHRSIYRFVYRLVGRADLAEDITQDCFLAFLREPERWRPERGDVRTYLFSIARNLVLKRYRDEHVNRQVEEGEAGDIADARSDQELSAAVAELVSQLPELQREALILFEYEGFQLTEIASIVNTEVGVVKSRLHRARERMKRLLTPYRKVGAHGLY